jgi:hypothetical protein
MGAFNEQVYMPNLLQAMAMLTNLAWLQTNNARLAGLCAQYKPTGEFRGPRYVWENFRGFSGLVKGETGRVEVVGAVL